MFEFARIERIPPYVFAAVDQLKMEARRAGRDVIDLGMGNPDLPTPAHIVDKLCEAARKSKNHRYSASRGIVQLRKAITEWYGRRFDVDVDPDTEAVATIGVKEGLSHLAYATLGPGDIVLTPTPSYPIHAYCAILAGAEVKYIMTGRGYDFFEEMERSLRSLWPKPKMLIINFPHNPTTECVDIDFFQKIIAFAKEHKIIVVHDFAYVDLCFDGYEAPSILQVKGAKDVAVEFVSLTKNYSMAGWRVGFCCGNAKVVGALAKIKSYLDYGIFQPIQIASIVALRGPQGSVSSIRETYQMRRDVLVQGLAKIGWHVDVPRATMFVWAKIPEIFRQMGSLEFSKIMIKDAQVAVSPGIGFGEGGEGFVRFALVENEQRIRQAIRGIKQVWESMS